MKKRLLNGLILVLIASMMLSVVACTPISQGMTTGATTTTASTTTSTTTTTTTTTTKEKADVDLDTLMLANDRVTVLSENGGELLITSVKNGSETIEIFYALDQTEGALAYKTTLDADGNVIAQSMVSDGGLYSFNEHGECYGFIVDPANAAYITNMFDIAGPWECDTCDEAYVEDGKIVIEAENSSDKAPEVKVSYTFYFNSETYLIEGYDCQVSGDATAQATYSATYTYGAEYTPNELAVERLSDDTANYTLIMNPRAEEEDLRKVALSKDAEIIALGSDGDYCVYLNMGCTDRLESIASLVEKQGEYEDCWLYVAPAGAYIDFEYELTEEYINEFNALAEEFKNICLESQDKDEITRAIEDLFDRQSYIMWQAQAGYLLYAQDYEAGEAAYLESTEWNNDAYLTMIDALKAVYESDAEFAKDIVFEGWTDEDFEIFERENEKMVELNEKKDKIEVDANEIMMEAGDEAWDIAAVDELYAQLIETNTELAALMGYDNGYDYLSEYIYGRYYTAEEREQFRSYVKEYIVPLFKDVYQLYYDSFTSLTDYEYSKIEEFLMTPYSDLRINYVEQYINSYEGSLNKKMHALFDKEAVIFGDGNDYHMTAFVNYSNYYGEPFAFYSSNYQSLLTIVHEMGHYVSAVDLDFSYLPYDTAEVHSQANEWLFITFMEPKMSKNIYNAFVSYSLVNIIYTIVHETLADEFEERAYTAEEPIEDYRALLYELCEEYGGAKFLNSLNYYGDTYLTVQRSAVTSSVYGVSYATSGIAALTFYALSQEDYAAAQEAYRGLQEDIDVKNDTFVEHLTHIGMTTPFDEETYINIRIAILGEDAADPDIAA